MLVKRLFGVWEILFLLSDWLRRGFWLAFRLPNQKLGEVPHVSVSAFWVRVVAKTDESDGDCEQNLLISLKK